MAGNTTTVGSVSFDLSVNTNALNQAISAAAQQINAQLTQGFSAALTGCENSMQRLGNSISQMANGVQNSVNGLSQSMMSTFQSTSAQIASNMQNSMTQMCQSLNGTMNNAASNLANGIQNQLTQMSGNVSQAVQGNSGQVSQALNQNANNLSQHLRNAAQQTSELGNQAQNTASSITNSLGNAVKKLGALIISAFAVKQVVAFTKSCVEAAAQVKALNAQLEQTFGTLETEARNAIKKVADESGILETRLQGVGTQIYAFAKASGMDSVNALNMMQEALQVTADSAAYYDRSLEDTAESLKAFLKGNYANDAALGISCTETTRNAAANKLYGKSFKDLSEAQKQLALLQMVKDANKLSGAMGQAAREADGWENVTGNLKEAWKQFQAAIGKPILQALIPIIHKITNAIQSLTETAKAATQALSELFGWDIDNAEDVGGAVSNAADTAVKAEEKVQEKIEETEKKQEKKAKNYLAGFDEMSVAKGPDEEENDSQEQKEQAEEITQSVQNTANSVDNLQDAVNSVNFDNIKSKIENLMNMFHTLTDKVKTYSQNVLDTAQKSIEKYVDKYGGTISEYTDKIKTHFENTAVQTSNGISNILNEANASLGRCSEDLSTGYADLLGGASIFALSFTDVLTGKLDILSKNFETWTSDNKDTIGTFFDGLNENAANAMTTFGGILGDIGTRLTEWWDDTGSEAFDKLTQAFFDVQTVLLDFWNNYITPFIDYIIDSVGELWDKHLSKLWDGILEFISSLMDTVTALWNGFLRPLYDTFIKRIMVGVLSALKSIWDAVCDAVGIIIDVIRGLIRSLQGVLDFITGIFTGDMEKAVKGFAEFVHGICIIIWGVIKGALNLVIDALNTVWSALYGVLKSIVDGVGDFVGAIGGLFGADWGFSMPDEVPRIPRLYNGGLATAPTLAMVGDNENASVDPEVIAPLSKLEGMLSGGIELNQIIELLREIISILRELDLTVIAEVDKRVLFEAIRKLSAEYERRTGAKAF